MINPDTGAYEPVDCVKLRLCSVPDTCRCDASGCQVWELSPELRLDFAIEGDESRTRLLRDVFAFAREASVRPD